VTRFDFIILAIMVISAVLGWHRGGLREIVTLVAIAAGFAAIGALGEQLSALAEGVIFRLGVLLVLFLLGYMVVLLAGGWLVRKFAGADKMKGDRIAGGLFGLLRGWIFGAFVFYTVSVYHTSAPLPRTVQESLFAPALQQTVLIFLRNADVTITKLSNPPSRAISPLSETIEA